MSPRPFAGYMPMERSKDRSGARQKSACATRSAKGDPLEGGWTGVAHNGPPQQDRLYAQPDKRSARHAPIKAMPSAPVGAWNKPHHPVANSADVSKHRTQHDAKPAPRATRFFRRFTAARSQPVNSRMFAHRMQGFYESFADSSLE